MKAQLNEFQAFGLDESPQETAWDASVRIHDALARDELEISDSDKTVLNVAARILEDYSK